MSLPRDLLLRVVHSSSPGALILIVFVLASAKPALAYDGDQAEQGAMIYYNYCAACHGGEGQGLTDAWRAAWGPDANCWAAGCHSERLPAIPQEPGMPPALGAPPALIGPGTLSRFASAQELHDFIRAAMPRWAPGLLSEKEYWAVSAFLIRARGIPADGLRLDASTAPDLLLTPSAERPPLSPWPALVVISASMVAFALVLRRVARAHNRPQV